MRYVVSLVMAGDQSRDGESAGEEEEEGQCEEGEGRAGVEEGKGEMIVGDSVAATVRVP
jgi:hypothetical protein